MSACCIQGVSVFGPGLPMWPEARLVLRGETPLENTQPPPPVPALLAPNERRRAGLPTRLALAVCEEAAAMSGLSPGELACVFASANGEAMIVHSLLETLAGPDRLLSPTQFHNSVHNAVAGYWSIATKSTQPMTCLAAHDHSFAAGLLQAVAECCASGRPVLLCQYDIPVPLPLGAGRGTAFAFATALVLAPVADRRTLASLTVEVEPAPDAEDDGPRQTGLRDLPRGNPGARGLRLLEALAMQRQDRFFLALPDLRLRVSISPS